MREADLLYWIGPDLETFLPRVLEGRSATTLAVQDISGLHLRRFGEEHRHDEEPADEHEDGHADVHVEGAETGEHDELHRPGALDAHLWLDPDNARKIASRMASDLSSSDPAFRGRHSGTFGRMRPVF
ncbi:zinc ABC transporter substrate-binding protein [Aquipseudomonas alcaligenes]